MGYLREDQLPVAITGEAVVHQHNLPLAVLAQPHLVGPFSGLVLEEGVWGRVGGECGRWGGGGECVHMWR